MKLMKKEIVVLLLLVFTIISCGFNNKPVTLDTENNIIFQNSSVGKFLSDAEENRDSLKEKYDNSYYAILGKIVEISKNDKKIVISDINDNSQMSIECSASNKSVIAVIRELKVNDIVNVYGKINVGILNKDISMDALQIIGAEKTEVFETSYSFIDGRTFDISNMDARQLADGKVKYYIPHNWTGVEKDIIKNDLGEMEGYQYTLNEISETLTVEPEVIFVSYFDSKKKIKDRSQIGEKKEIRKTIIANILKTGEEEIKNREIKKRKSYYGAEYYYYDGTYEDKLGQGHYVEFVFQEVSNDGMVVYLYVYREEKHLEDILSVMRCLTIS